MVHLPPLPGAPGYESDRTAIRERAVADARALVEGGVDGVIVENFGDAPFYPEDVPGHVVADLTRLTTAVTDAVDVPVGVNVLRNDATAAVSVAAAAGADFVRGNVHTGARVTDQGIVEGRAHETLRHRERIDADVAILADVAVKHSTPLGEQDLDAAVADTIERGRADGIVVSGPATGAAADADDLRQVCARRAEIDADVPVFVGSGVTAENVTDLLDVADGAIVGTALKEAGPDGDPDATNPVDSERVTAVVRAAGRDPD
jgi:membrane complex biogenesis BtpA family protein